MMADQVCSPDESDGGSNYIFYNYPSAPCSEIDKLLSFVKSKLSLSSFDAFIFCYDESKTPSEIVDATKNVPKMELLSVKEPYERDIRRRVLSLNSIEEMQLIMITGSEEYTALWDELPHTWELVIFYPKGTDPYFYEVADCALELPQWETKSVEYNSPKSQSLRELHSSLVSVLNKLTEINSWVYGVLEVDQEVDEEDEDEEDEEESDHENSEREEPSIEEEEDEQDLNTVRPDNGYDSFPEPDTDAVARTNKWDDEDQVSKKTEKGNRPGGGENPFQTAELKKSNPFRNPFDEVSLPVKAVYKRETFEEEKPYFANVKKSQKPFHGHQEHVPRRNPFNVSGANFQLKDFRKPAPQCPHWESHQSESNCPLWHPHKKCAFYPTCRATARNCGYAHPFCSPEDCRCKGVKDPQLNHFGAFQ